MRLAANVSRPAGTKKPLPCRGRRTARMQALGREMFMPSLRLTSREACRASSEWLPSGPRVPVQQGRDLSSLHRQLQAADACSAKSTWASTAEPPRAWPPLGCEPGGHQRPLDQSRAGATESSIRAKHARLRASWIRRAATFGGVVAARRGTSWHPQGTEQKERHLAISLSASHHWLRGPDLN